MSVLSPNPAAWRRVASYQKFFGERWAAFLRENFHSPEQIGAAFGCSAQTATNWLNEVSAPRGPFVALALTEPALAESARRHLTLAA